MSNIIIVDIETDGLINYSDDTYPTVIHCIVTYDVGTKEQRVFTSALDNLKEFNDYASTADYIIGHNVIAYDVPVLNDLLGSNIPISKVRDTLVMSRLYDPMLKGGHSLASWGDRFRYPKGDHSDWTKYSEEMLAYCKQDVSITTRLYSWLIDKGLKDFSDFSIELEHRVNVIVSELTKNGAPIDIDMTLGLIEECTTEREDILSTINDLFPPEKVLKQANRAVKYTKDGLMYSVDAKALGKPEHICELQDDGTYNIYTMVPFNPASPKQVLSKLENTGWKPYIKTKSGQNWSVCEENLNTLPTDAPDGVKGLARIKVLKSRMDAMKGWLKAYSNVTESVHPNVITCGTKTHRMSHRNPQTGNIPAGYNYLGKEMRSCFRTPSPDYKVVGMDLANIQLSVLAHHMDDPVYINALETGDKNKGTDIHTVNQKIAGLASRDLSKKFIYSLILNASNTKLAEDQGYTVADAKRSREKLMNELVGFKRIDNLVDKLAEQGYYKSLDGRVINVPGHHTALATVLQSDEACAMKVALCLIDKGIQELELDARIMLIVHDEVQALVHIDDVEKYEKMVLEAVTKAGEILRFKCKLMGETQVGDNWYETH